MRFDAMYDPRSIKQHVQKTELVPDAPLLPPSITVSACPCGDGETEVELARRSVRRVRRHHGLRATLGLQLRWRGLLQRRHLHKRGERIAVTRAPLQTLVQQKSNSTLKNCFCIPVNMNSLMFSFLITRWIKRPLGGP